MSGHIGGVGNRSLRGRIATAIAGDRSHRQPNASTGGWSSFGGHVRRGTARPGAHLRPTTHVGERCCRRRRSTPRCRRRRCHRRPPEGSRRTRRPRGGVAVRERCRSRVGRLIVSPERMTSSPPGATHSARYDSVRDVTRVLRSGLPGLRSHSLRPPQFGALMLANRWAVSLVANTKAGHAGGLPGIGTHRRSSPAREIVGRA